jgi:hypothetical protein
MVVDPDWLKDYGPSLRFIARQVSPFMTPGFLSIPLALAFPALRKALKDKLAFAAFCAVPFLWIFLVAWCAIFVGAMDGRYDSPWWADVPLYLNFWGLPVAAVILIVQAKGARWISFGYAFLNAVPWLFVSFIAAMAISGDWI